MDINKILCLNIILIYYSVNLNSHAGSVCLQPCVLNQPLEVEMLMQYVLMFVLKLPFRLNVYLLLLLGGMERR